MQNGQPPFKGEAGKREIGYRDYLIWESILRIPEIALGHRSPDVAFLCANTSDFAKGGALHPFLLKEAEVVGLNVRLYIDLQSFVDQVAKPLLPKSVVVETLLKDDSHVEHIRRFVADHIEDSAVGYEVADTLDIVDYVRVESPSIEHVEVDVDELRVDETYESDDSEAVIEVTIPAQLDVGYFVYKADSYSLDDDGAVSLTDWNEHYFYGHSVRQALLHLGVVVDVHSDELAPERLEVIGIELV